MRKSLFVLVACCSLNMVCAQRNTEWGTSATRSRPLQSAIAKIAEDPVISKNYINEVLKDCCSLAYEEESELQKRGFKLFYRGGIENEGKKDKFAGFIRQEDDKLIVSFPGTRLDEKLIKLASELAESCRETLKWLVPGMKSDRDVDVLAGLISSGSKAVRDASALKAAVSDLIADIKGIGDDGGFADSLEREGVVVHSGFAKEVMEFYEAMLDEINSYKGVREIHFTGHSKGGGVAILTALKFASDVERGGINRFQDENAIKVATFAAPCVLNPEGADMFHNIIDPYNAICIYKNLDAVPYLPFALSALPNKWTGWANFFHVGVQANISKKGREVLGSLLEMTGMRQLSLKELIEKAVGLRNPGWLAAWKVILQTGKDVYNAHLMANFSYDSVNEIVGRISDNYKKDQNMSRNRIGRGKRPFFRSLAFWKK